MSTEINLDQLYNNSVKILSDLISFKTISGEDNSELINYCEKYPSAAKSLNADVVKVLADYCESKKSKLIQISTDHYYINDLDTEQSSYFDYGTNDDVYGDYY